MKALLLGIIVVIACVGLIVIKLLTRIAHHLQSLTQTREDGTPADPPDYTRRSTLYPVFPQSMIDKQKDALDKCAEEWQVRLQDFRRLEIEEIETCHISGGNWTDFKPSRALRRMATDVAIFIKAVKENEAGYDMLIEGNLAVIRGEKIREVQDRFLNMSEGARFYGITPVIYGARQDDHKDEGLEFLDSRHSAWEEDFHVLSHTKEEDEG